MKPTKTILIILLTTATLGAATDPRLALWTFWGAIDPWTTEVLFQCGLPPDDIRYGTAFDEGYLWHREWEPHTVNYYYKIDLYGDIVSSFPGPVIDDYGGRGIDTDNDGNLWICYNLYIYHVTDTGSIIPPPPFPVYYYYPDDIAWDGEYLWAIDCALEGVSIYKYDVYTGQLIDGFWIPGGSQTWHGSIAADEEYLYLNWGNDGYEWEPANFYYITTHTGETVCYYEDEVTWTYGWDIAEWPILSVKPKSFGQIKAMFR